MQITLTKQEAQSLQRMLEDYLPDLENELSRTDIASRELRHELAERRDLCEKLLAQLAEAASPAPAA